MVLIISIVAFLVVTILFVLDTAKEQSTTSEVSTYLSPLESETFVSHNYSANIDTVWKAITNLSDYNYWFPGVARILPVVNTDRYVHRYSYDQFSFAPGSHLTIKNRGIFPSGKGMIASSVPNKKFEMIFQYNPLHKEFITFNLSSQPDGTTLSLKRKSYGLFSFMSVWGFDSRKSKALDNLGYIIPEEDFTADNSKDKESKTVDTSGDLFQDRNQMAAYLVNKTLDGDNNIIKSTADVYARGKAKALLMKINKGTAERPPMPEAGSSPASPTPTAQTAPSMSKDDIIATVVNKALDGDDGPLNELSDKVLRAKSKSLIMKINKGTAERPPMPGQNDTHNKSANTQEKDDSGNEQIVTTKTESDNEIIARLVDDGLNGKMDEINNLENKVMRGKIKAAIVKAKRSKQ